MPYPKIERQGTSRPHASPSQHTPRRRGSAQATGQSHQTWSRKRTPYPQIERQGTSRPHAPPSYRTPCDRGSAQARLQSHQTWSGRRMPSKYRTPTHQSATCTAQLPHAMRPWKRTGKTPKPSDMESHTKYHPHPKIERPKN